jgi:hypothetical protein
MNSAGWFMKGAPPPPLVDGLNTPLAPSSDKTGPTIENTIDLRERGAMIFAPLSGRVIKGGAKLSKNGIASVQILTEIGDTRIVNVLTGMRFPNSIIMGENKIKRGDTLGLTADPTVFQGDSGRLVWNVFVNSPEILERGGAWVNPIAYANQQMGGLFFIDDKDVLKDEVPPNAPVPALAPAPELPPVAPAASSNLMPILLLGGAAWFFLGKKKKGSK